MMFLAPSALFAIALLALPIIIHLLKPRKMRPTPFSSLRWLRHTHQRLSRRLQWHQWLLFALRAGLITLLVLALARPLFHARESGRPVDRFVVVDVGRGMAYRTPGQPSPLEKAQELAADLLRNLRPGDRTAVVLAGARPRLIAPLAADASAQIPALQAVRPTEADSHPDAALPLVRSLLRREEGRELELVFVTENRTHSWQQSAIHEFLREVHRPLRVQILDVGPAAPRNGWISAARLLSAQGDEGRILRVELGCVGDTPQERRVHLRGLAGLVEESQAVTLLPGQRSHLDFKLPQADNREGQVVEARLEPDDALVDDDRLFVNLDTSVALRLLLVGPETPGRDGSPVDLYLRTALEALTAADRQKLDVVGRTSASVSSGDVERADLTILAGVPELADSVVQELQKRVRAGAGLIVFLGDGIKTPFYNQSLYHQLQPAEGLLPSPLKSGDESMIRPQEPAVWGRWRWTHPLLAPLDDPVFGDLTQTRAQRYAGFAAEVGAKDNVLAYFSDDVPALIEHPLGGGRVLVFNTSANDAWSDLPRRKSYVPLLDRVVSYLSAGGLQRRFTVGEPVTLPLVGHVAGASVEVITPDGTRLTPRMLTAGEQTLLHLESVPEAGVYRVDRSGGKGFTFVANASREQSRLMPMEAKTLHEWWAPATVEMLTEEAVTQRHTGSPASWSLWPALVLLAGLLLLAETIYVAVLCPRAAPTVVDSLVPHRGLLRPLNETAATEPS